MDQTDSHLDLISPDSSTILVNGFLLNADEELSSFIRISESNLVGLEYKISNASKIVRKYSSKSIDSNSITAELLKLKKENLETINFLNGKKVELQAMKINNINNLEQTLESLEKQYETLKTERKTKQLEDHQTLKMLKKALKYYTTYFQFKINYISNEEDKYSIELKFLINGTESQPSILFCFDRKNDGLINFNADGLLTQLQHEKIHKRLKETNNFLALFGLLWEAVQRKHGCS